MVGNLTRWLFRIPSWRRDRSVQAGSTLQRRYRSLAEGGSHCFLLRLRSASLFRIPDCKGMETFQIKDSYRIHSRKEMRSQIEAHRLIWPTNKALKRKTASLVREWCGHNLLYSIGLFRSHTKDVDFEAEPKWYAELAWFVLSMMYWM